jgi:transposase
VSQLKEVLEGRMIEPQRETEENLCADAGYAGSPAEQTISGHGFIPHVRSRGAEKAAMKKGYKPRRWIVEVAHSWFNRFRKIHTRYEKTFIAYYALLCLAAAMITMNKMMKIYPAL